MKFWKKNKWFTFVEILWVLMIIAILLSISVVSFRHSQAKARDVVRKSDLQMIADALISYGNDHWHFPSSIYDNWKVFTISQALNMVSEWWNYWYSWNSISFYPDIETIKNLLWQNIIQEHPEYFIRRQAVQAWINADTLTDIYTLKSGINFPPEFDSLVSIIENEQDNTPVITDSAITNFNYSIITQWMCASLLKKYLVNEWYISTIPWDPAWESVNLQTNICVEPWTTFEHWFNANDTWWSIQWGGECYASTNFWCTQICKEWYVYVSDGEHFALIAHMESENGWNYEVTSCWSCDSNCENTTPENKESRTSTDQLPCDITDEFTNSFNCIQENWIVEYNAWEYYFYIY